MKYNTIDETKEYNIIEIEDGTIFYYCGVDQTDGEYITKSKESLKASCQEPKSYGLQRAMMILNRAIELYGGEWGIVPKITL